ncbi:MAG TPA: alpha/beta fold hydrolase [Vicinamibacteria bacterium]
MARNDSFDIAGPAGGLEAVLMHPEEAPQAAAVVCHAHPLHGGMMHFKPVFRAAKALQEQGVAALRFNFRGVGRSAGTHDEGRGEQDDLRAALDEIGRRFPGVPLFAGGFSFGSAVALRVAARDERVRAAFALGFPLSMVADPSFVTARALPRLFVQGEQDVYGAREAIQDLGAGATPPAEVVVVPGADHFFAGHLDELQDAVSRWAARRPWAPG